MRYKLRGVFVFNNGMCAVTDEYGQQIPELQGTWEESKVKLQQADLDLSKCDFDQRLEIEKYHS